jgi:hypothetical protein
LIDPSEMLRELVAGVIAQSGGVVEPAGTLGLDFVAPEPVQRSLLLPEFGRLSFGPDSVSGAERVSFESDWIERLEALMGDRGKLGRAVVQVDVPHLSNPSRILEHGFVLNNAVYRLIDTAPVSTLYLLLAFRYTAVSDEKRTGIVELLLNLGTGSTPFDFIAQIREAVYQCGTLHPDDAARFSGSLSARWSSDSIAKAIRTALAGEISRDLSPFVAGMRRRLSRDHTRLIDYHEGLRQESLKRARKKGGDIEREKARVDAISLEYRAKVADLCQKYALTIDVKLLQAVEIIMPVRRFNLVIKRRKAERGLSLDWNPLARKLEPPPCEYSFTADPGRLVCDRASHIVSLPGLAPCAGCAKEFCRVCSPNSCPKCGRPLSPQLLL